MNTFKKIIASAAVVIATFSMSGCSTVSTQPDEAALHYSGGPFSSKQFKNCIEPSNRAFDGPGDSHYTYPANQRTFSFTGAKGSERGPIAVTTGSQEVLVPGFVTFTLNTDCKVLRKFHETVGMKYKAYEGGGGWHSFLNDYIAIPLDATMNKAAGAISTPAGQSRDQNWYRLYTEAAVQKEFESYVKENLPSEIENTLGSEFITVNSVSISKPDVGEGLKKGLAGKEEARLQNDAQKEKNSVARTKYDSLKDCRRSGLSENACVMIFLAESGDIPFYPVPNGGNLNVTPGTK